jgi:methionyl-tRNA formyltransferase
MHYVDKGLDTGPVIAQKWFRISQNETRLSLYNKSDKACFELLKENLTKIMSKKIKLDPQRSKERTYYPKSLPNDGFLDLNWDAAKQKRFIRAIAFPGFPGPKLKIGRITYTLLYDDLEFFSAIKHIKS